jgi:hypothetical protein
MYQIYFKLHLSCENRLFEACIDLGIPELLKEHDFLAAKQIIAQLNLTPTRGWKFLHALALAGFNKQQY